MPELGRLARSQQAPGEPASPFSGHRGPRRPRHPGARVPALCSAPAFSTHPLFRKRNSEPFPPSSSLNSLEAGFSLLHPPPTLFPPPCLRLSSATTFQTPRSSGRARARSQLGGRRRPSARTSGPRAAARAWGGSRPRHVPGAAGRARCPWRSGCGWRRGLPAGRAAGPYPGLDPLRAGGGCGQNAHLSLALERGRRLRKGAWCLWFLTVAQPMF